jgi:ribosomal protein S18 acetylase RimI-like enzyme
MIKYQRPGISDAVAISALLKKSWKDSYSDLFSQEELRKVSSEWHAVEAISDRVTDRSVFVEVARDGDRVVGVCDATFDIAVGKINIQKLHISIDYQRQGIGSELNKRAVSAFPGAKRVELEVLTKNDKARAFYKKHGFRNVGQKTFELEGVKLPCVVMEKSL